MSCLRSDIEVVYMGKYDSVGVKSMCKLGRITRKLNKVLIVFNSDNCI